MRSLLFTIALLCALPDAWPADLAGTDAGAAKPLNVVRSSVNRDRGGASFNFAQLTDLHIGEGASDYGTPGYDDAPPGGDIGGPAKTLRAAVEWINANKDAERIAFVMVTGDLTASAERSEYLKVKEILDSLSVPYVPLIGNHDVWPYVMTSRTTYEQAPVPLGDRTFNEVFAPTFRKLAAAFPRWDNGTRLAAVPDKQGSRSYLENFAFSYRGYRLICLDFNPRSPAGFDFNPEAAIHSHPPGIGPEASLHDVPGGTVSWLRSELANNPVKGTRNVLLFAHHPLSKRLIDFIKKSFSIGDYERMAKLLRKNGGAVALWDAGHIHRNAEYGIKTLEFQDTGVNGIETGALKDGSLRLITVWGASPGGR
ncbi:MAG: metallophosphoesterase [Elusimicrobia bacterium]|nr:metallophosphoesterase [Elusimicrobiota bacterium]